MKTLPILRSAIVAAFLLLFAIAPAAAATPDPAGRWALHAGGRALMVLELRRDPAARGGWTGTLSRPANIDLAVGSSASGHYRWTNIRLPVETRPLVSATAEGDSLRLEFAGPAEGRDRATFRALPGGRYAEFADDPERAAPFRLVRAEPGEWVAADWDPARSYAADPQWPSNSEMAAMFAADQGARQNPAGIDWDVLGPQDEARRLRTRALLASGDLQSGGDYYHAAFVFQHGSTPDDYLLAHALAMVAVARGRPDASWIAAATLDRYLQNIGRPQVFGTQYSTPPGEPTNQEPYDRALVSDALRNAVGVPGQAAQEQRRLEIQSRYRQPPQPVQPPR